MSAPATAPKHSLDQREVLARQGLRLPAPTLKRLRSAGIYCQPSISIEHQHLAKRYILRGVESGGAVADLGKSVGGSIGGSVGRALVRGALGGLLRR